MPPKRKAAEAEVEQDVTPRKTRRTAQQDAINTTDLLAQAETPSTRRSILRGTPSKPSLLPIDGEPTPRSVRKVLFTTPAKAESEDETQRTNQDHETPAAVRNDRSAQRKSRQILHIAPVGDEDDSDADEVQVSHNRAIAAAILQDDNSSDGEEDEPATNAPETPSKSTGKLRGRPKGRRRERTPSPPPSDMPPHELYFYQNRTGANKTSANTLPSRLLLNHDDYFAHVATHKDPHENDMARLKQLHKRGFDQWSFELEEGYNLCLYGYGSKRKLAMDFADHMYHREEGLSKIVVVNGYAPGLTVRNILAAIASVVLPKDVKLPATPAAMLDSVLEYLTARPPKHSILLVVHSLDHENLRKQATQSILARLASHASISLLATCDTPNFALLWDVSLSRQFHWLYHDATTFEPYSAELDVVEEVNALLGRSGRRLGGKDGVGYVLKSLPENARNLFRILVSEQLVLMMGEDGDAVAGATFAANHDEDMADADDLLGVDDEEEAANMQGTPSKKGRKPKGKTAATRKPKAVVPVATTVAEGVEYRTLYHKAVEEFVCSSELNLRTLLKEFHDHQMVESRKDGMGTERLVVPFRREELEAILEEIA